MAIPAGVIYFEDDMRFTDAPFVVGYRIEKSGNWLRFTIGKGEDWEKVLSVPAHKVSYIKHMDNPE
jgi:hypothetical protein